MYVGFRVDEENENDWVDEFVRSSIAKINQNFEGEIQLDEEFAEPTKSKWKRPQPPYHVTSLFVNRKKENLEKEEYKQFKEGILERIMIKGYIIVENFIMIAMLFPKSTIIENIVIIFIC